MKDSWHIFLVGQLLGVLTCHRQDQRSLSADQIPCGSSKSTHSDACAFTESSRAFESGAPSLLSSVVACPGHHQCSATSPLSSRATGDGLKAHATFRPASGHGGTNRMKDSWHIFFVVQRLGVLTCHRPNQRSLSADQIPCGGLTSTHSGACALIESSRAFESGAPSILRERHGMPWPPSTQCNVTPIVTSDRERFKSTRHLPPRQWAWQYKQNEGLMADIFCCAAPGRSYLPSTESAFTVRRPDSLWRLDIDALGGLRTH
ncbi:hypothetical protein MRX96_053136 [Rhipicephalus microplus]